MVSLSTYLCHNQFLGSNSPGKFHHPRLPPGNSTQSLWSRLERRGYVSGHTWPCSQTTVQIHLTALEIRPQYSIPFFLPIILFSNSQNSPLSFLWLFLNFLIQNTIIVHAVCKYSVSALCGIWLSTESSKVSMLSCDSCPFIAHYAQLSWFICTWLLIQTLNLDLANLTPLFPIYSSFISPPIIPKEIPK